MLYEGDLDLVFGYEDLPCIEIDKVFEILKQLKT